MWFMWFCFRINFMWNWFHQPVKGLNFRDVHTLLHNYIKFHQWVIWFCAFRRGSIQVTLVRTQVRLSWSNEWLQVAARKPPATVSLWDFVVAELLAFPAFLNLPHPPPHPTPPSSTFWLDHRCDKLVSLFSNHIIPVKLNLKWFWNALILIVVPNLTIIQGI